MKASVISQHHLPPIIVDRIINNIQRLNHYHFTPSIHGENDLMEITIQNNTPGYHFTDRSVMLEDYTRNISSALQWFNIDATVIYSLDQY